MVSDSIISWIVLLVFGYAGFITLFLMATKRPGFQKKESEEITKVYRYF